MRQRNYTTAKLPKHLLEEIGAQNTLYKGPSRHSTPSARKEQRKTARVQKKTRGVPARAAPPDQRRNGETQKVPTRAHVKSKGNDAAEAQTKPLKSILKTSKARPPTKALPRQRELSVPSPPPQPRPSKGLRDRLATDDAEIAALEKALGVKGNKKLPKSFEEDGLDVLLEGLGDTSADAANANGKRRRSEEEQWLQRKRLKAQRPNPMSVVEANGVVPEAAVTSSDDDASADGDSGEIDEESDQGFDSDESFKDLSDGTPLPEIMVTRSRENPYVAPAAPSEMASANKYIPPSARDRGIATSNDLSRLQRRIQGLLNRLSEANLLALLKDFEALYRDNPRQDVSSTLLDLLVDLLADPSALQDTFVILHAGFIAALYKVVGPDFGAQAIATVHNEFKKLYQARGKGDASNKKLVNLVTLFAHLYNFRVIGSNLIYDLVRLFIKDLSETDTELVLKIAKSSGSQLRKDDPGSLKAINQSLQSAVAEVGSKTLSVRTSFMVETVNNLANKGIKTGVADSLVSAEHLTRTRGLLGSLNERNVKSSEPLGISLKDLRETEKRGKWWLVGASYKDDEESSGKQTPPRDMVVSAENEDNKVTIISENTDLARVARHLGINTDVRRSIFVTIMSADDYETAYKRLQKLRLNSSQKTEIPRVLIRCSSAQENYNPFFTLLARRLISAEPKLGKTFQFSIWTFFDRMREAEGGNELEDTDQPEQLGPTSILNLARMVGTLIADDGLSLRVLKILNLAYLPGKLQHFVELLLITVILQSQSKPNGSRDEKRLIHIFLKPKEMPDMARGMQYFLRKVVGKTDIAGNEEDRQTVEWGCKVARDTLKAISVPAVVAQ